MRSLTSNRKVHVFLGMLATSALLTACGAAQEPVNTPAANAPESVADAPGFKDLSGEIMFYTPGGGEQSKILQEVGLDSFTDFTGVPVRQDFHPDMTQFWAGEQADRVPWSLLQFDGPSSAVKSLEDDMLQPLDESVVPTDMVDGEDYDKKYLVPAGRYGTVLTWNTTKYPATGAHPETMADFYDTEKFPGKRCLYKAPQAGATLESAVQAGGVAPEDVYPIDLDLAFEQLDSIRDDTVWFTSGGDSIRFLVNGECDMAITWTAQIYLAVHTNDAPLAVSWNGGVYANQFMAIPKSAPNPEAANALIAYLIRDRDVTRDLAIGTGVAMPLVPALDLPENAKSFLVSPENIENAVAEDGEYFASNIDMLNTAFNEWLSK